MSNRPQRPPSSAFSCLAVPAFLCTVALAIPQEPPQPDELAAITPLMAELRKEAWNADKAKSVIEALIAADHHAAAAWWVASSHEAIKAKKLPAGSQGALNALRKRCELEGASADDRKLALKLVRHLESVVTAKNFDEAKDVLRIARAVCRLAPESATQRALEAAEKKIAAGKGIGDPSNLPRQKQQFADMREPVTQLVATRLERLVSEYRRAGCRTGRFAIEAAIKDSAPLFDQKESQDRIRALRASAREVEPTMTLGLATKSWDPVRAFLDGTPCDQRGGPIVEIAVLPGDLVQLCIPREGDYMADGKSALHVAAVSARLDGKDLGAKCLFLNASRNAYELDPPLGKIEFLRARGDDKILDQYPPRSKFEKYGAFITMGLDGKRVACDVGENCARYEEEMKEASLPFVWVGAIAESLVVVVKIPAE